jgi:hypothetical protein
MIIKLLFIYVHTYYPKNQLQPQIKVIIIIIINSLWLLSRPMAVKSARK